MCKYYSLILLLAFSLQISTFSQRPENPQKLKSSDFLIDNAPPQISYLRTLVTFPFQEDKSNGKVTDNQFKLSIKSISRLHLSKASCNIDYVLSSKLLVSPPIIQSIDYYYLEGNKIKKREIKNSDLIVENNDLFYYVNFSSLINDSLVIIDLSYYVTSEKKDLIVLVNPASIPIQDMKLIVDIPEIYLYKNLITSDCLMVKASSHLGSIRGYRLANSSGSITGEILAKVFKEQFPNANYEPVYYKLNSNIYTWIKDCKMDSSIFSKPILSLVISNKTELK
jgi:hypothetical protein